MPRTFSLALAFAATATAAHAQTPPLTNKWDGAIRIVNQTQNCARQFASQDTNRAFYHLNLDPDHGFWTITRFGNGETELIDFYSNSGNPTGNQGFYFTHVMARGFIDEFQGGSYSFNQTPATVTATTKFIDLSGTLSDYGTTGCTITLQGTFVLVEPVEPPPEPY